MKWLAVALLSLIAAPAAADEPGPRPPLPDELPRDYDADAESYSDFWEEALRPHAKEYDAKVKTAEVQLAAVGPSTAAQQNAERLLRDAIALQPETPTAYWLLGQLYEQQQQWAECAKQRQKVFDLDPSFAPATRGARGWELDVALGDCLALAGELEEAIAHYRRILASGNTEYSSAHVKLAMAYMALGRITDAIEAYELAMDDPQTNPRGPRRAAFMYLGAAVAYDRDEQVARAKELIDLGLRYDRSLSAFADPDNRFLVPEDETYFRGLAESADPRRRAFAIAYFRRYIAIAGDDGWTRRARDHLDELTAVEFGDDDVTIRGAGLIDAKKARTAVLARMDDIHACLARSPSLLFRVTITKIAADGARPAKHERGARKPRPGYQPIPPPQDGVHVRQELAFDSATPTSDVFQAQECITEAARSIRLPKVTGSLHSYAALDFLVTAR